MILFFHIYSAMEKILSSIQPVVENSKYVYINRAKIRDFSRNFNPQEIRQWLDFAPFEIKKLNTEDRVAFLFVLHSTSFCYWGNPKWSVGYKGKIYDGTWGLIASLGKAVEENKPILDPSYLRDIPQNEAKRIFRGNVKIPLFEDRLQLLRELGRVTAEKYGEDFSKIVENSNNDALKLVNVLMTDFHSFNDFSLYEGKPVYFQKRAQLLVSDISNVFKLKNIEQLTACADYKLPKVLRENKILEYDKELSKKIDAQIEISKGSREEIEIRANTIFAVELIKKQLKNRIPEITSTQINDYLWMEGQKNSKNEKPYHLTRTTAY